MLHVHVAVDLIARWSPVVSDQNERQTVTHLCHSKCAHFVITGNLLFFFLREKRLAKKYYDKLFKEYCISDLSRYKENKVLSVFKTCKCASLKVSYSFILNITFSKEISARIFFFCFAIKGSWAEMERTSKTFLTMLPGPLSLVVLYQPYNLPNEGHYICFISL